MSTVGRQKMLRRNTLMVGTNGLMDNDTTDTYAVSFRGFRSSKTPKAIVRASLNARSSSMSDNIPELVVRGASHALPSVQTTQSTTQSTVYRKSETSLIPSTIMNTSHTMLTTHAHTSQDSGSVNSAHPATSDTTFHTSFRTRAKTDHSIEFNENLSRNNRIRSRCVSATLATSSDSQSPCPHNHSPQDGYFSPAHREDQHSSFAISRRTVYPETTREPKYLNTHINTSRNAQDQWRSQTPTASSDKFLLQHQENVSSTPNARLHMNTLSRRRYGIRSSRASTPFSGVSEIDIGEPPVLPSPQSNVTTNRTLDSVQSDDDHMILKSPDRISSIEQHKPKLDDPTRPHSHSNINKPIDATNFAGDSSNPNFNTRNISEVQNRATTSCTTAPLRRRGTLHKLANRGQNRRPSGSAYPRVYEPQHGSKSSIPLNGIVTTSQTPSESDVKHQLYDTSRQKVSNQVVVGLTDQIYMETKNTLGQVDQIQPFPEKSHILTTRPASNIADYLHFPHTDALDTIDVASTSSLPEQTRTEMVSLLQSEQESHKITANSTSSQEQDTVSNDSDVSVFSDIPTDVLARSKIDPTQFKQNEMIGVYKIGESLGSGGFGQVRLGQHTQTGEYVALKFLPKGKLLSTGDIERVLTEIQCLTKLSHPNITKLYSVMNEARYVILVLEYAPGGDLKQFVASQKHKRLSIAVSLLLFGQILRGVAFAHENRITHRDLKLENVLLSQQGTCMLSDFGLSSFYQPGDRSRSTAGSLLYMAPEVLAGKVSEGPPLDTWGLGIMLYTMIVGKTPFEYAADIDDYAPSEEQQSVTLRSYWATIPYKRPLVSKAARVRAAILALDYRIPSFVPIEVAKLIRTLLDPNPQLRPTISHLKSKRWIFDFPRRLQVRSFLDLWRLPAAIQKRFVVNRNGKRHNKVVTSLCRQLQNFWKDTGYYAEDQSTSSISSSDTEENNGVDNNDETTLTSTNQSITVPHTTNLTTSSHAIQIRESPMTIKNQISSFSNKTNNVVHIVPSKVLQKSTQDNLVIDSDRKSTPTGIPDTRYMSDVQNTSGTAFDTAEQTLFQANSTRHITIEMSDESKPMNSPKELPHISKNSSHTSIGSYISNSTSNLNNNKKTSSAYHHKHLQKNYISSGETQVNTKSMNTTNLSSSATAATASSSATASASVTAAASGVTHLHTTGMNTTKSSSEIFQEVPIHDIQRKLSATANDSLFHETRSTESPCNTYFQGFNNSSDSHTNEQHKNDLECHVASTTSLVQLRQIARKQSQCSNDSSIPTLNESSEIENTRNVSNSAQNGSRRSVLYRHGGSMTQRLPHLPLSNPTSSNRQVQHPHEVLNGINMRQKPRNASLEEIVSTTSTNTASKIRRSSLPTTHLLSSQISPETHGKHLLENDKQSKQSRKSVSFSNSISNSSHYPKVEHNSAHHSSDIQAIRNLPINVVPVPPPINSARSTETCSSDASTKSLRARRPKLVPSISWDHTGG